MLGQDLSGRVHGEGLGHAGHAILHPCGAVGVVQHRIEGVSQPGQAVNDRATRIAKIENLRRLVESLTGGVVYVDGGVNLIA